MVEREDSLYPQKMPFVITITKFAGTTIYGAFNLMTLGIPDRLRRGINTGAIIGRSDAEDSQVIYQVLMGKAKNKRVSPLPRIIRCII